MGVKTPIISPEFFIHAPKIMFQTFNSMKFNHSLLDPRDCEF
jgi:hypothetical protein